MQETIKDFLTLSSILTFGGASIGVIAVSNTVRVLTNWNSPWPAFIISQIIVFIGTFTVASHPSIAQLGLAFVNGCLLFTTSAGIQNTGVRITQPEPADKIKAQSGERVKWLSKWI
jgi:hypothetical protein